MLQIIPIKGIPLIKPNDDLAKITVAALKRQGISLETTDILLYVQSIVSKSENRIVDLQTITPSERSIELSKQFDKPAALIELIFRESKRIEKMVPPHIIVETHQGFVCANAGIDASNSGGSHLVTLLPIDADKSANRIREGIRRLTKVSPGVIITDTHGRPFREGAVNIAIGTAGVPPIIEYVGRKDLYDYELRTTSIGVIDELASAAELVTGESDEGIPIVLIRGLDIPWGNHSIKEIIRSREKDIFR